jgi:hypothetical protein
MYIPRKKGISGTLKERLSSGEGSKLENIIEHVQERTIESKTYTYFAQPSYVKSKLTQEEFRTLYDNRKEIREEERYHLVKECSSKKEKIFMGAVALLAYSIDFIVWNIFTRRKKIGKFTTKWFNNYITYMTEPETTHNPSEEEIKRQDRLYCIREKLIIKLPE